MLRVLLNGTYPQNNPTGIENLEERFTYSNTLKIYYTEITGDLTFWGADFDYLYNQFKGDLCTRIPVEIQESEGDERSYKELFRGYIIAKDIDFDLTRRFAKCQIIDDGFMASIVNNADLQVPIRSVFGTTKNGQTLNATVTTNVTVRTTNSIGSNMITGVSIHEAFRYIVAWMTDYGVDFESDYLLNNTDVNSYFFSTGLSIRTGVSDLPVISFKDFVSDMNKLWHIYGYFYRAANGKLTLKFEPYEFFENIQGSNTVTKADSITLKSAEEVFYTSILLGSPKNESVADDKGLPVDTAELWCIPGLNEPFAGFSNKDEFIIDTKCNKPNSLDLRPSKVIADINSISRIIADPSYTDYDADVFLIQRETEWELLPHFPFDTTVTPETPIFGTFNKSLFNREVLGRWLSEICLPPIEDIPLCEAKGENSADLIQTVATWYTLDLYDDPCDIFNVGSNDSRFVATSFRNYNLKVKIELYNHTGVNQNVEISMFGVGTTSPTFRTHPSESFFFAYAYDFQQFFFTAQDTTNGWTGQTVVNSGYSEYVARTFTPGETAFYEVEIPAMLFYETGQFNLLVGCSTSLGAITVKAGSFIQVTNPLLDIIRKADIQNFCDIYPYEHTIETALTPNEARNIRDNQFRKILVPNNFKNVSGRIKEMNRNLLTNNTTIKVKSKTC